MKANEYNHLIILGNGFDLKCGLHTTYEAFFDKRFGIEEACKVNKKTDKSECRRKLKERLKYQIQDRFYLEYFDDTEFIQDIVFNNFRENIRLSGISPQDQKKVLDREKNRLNEIQYTKWDAIFLFTFATLTDKSIIYWNDVERIIYFVITWALEKYEEVEKSLTDNEYDEDYEKILDADLYNSFILFFSNFDFEDLGSQEDVYIRNNIKFLAPEYLRLIIEKQFMTINKIIDSKNIDSIAIKMLQSLNDFEKEFSNFIVEQINNKNRGKVTYIDMASELLSSIIQPHIETLDARKRPEDYPAVGSPTINLDILNFNYSLNQSNVSKIESRVKTTEILNINSFTNIHGIATDNSQKNLNDKLPDPIFGVDSYDVLVASRKNNTNFDDPRIIFTKSFRLMDNHINDIRTSNFQDNVDVITFFGHSLSHADYSYFESIFDKYQIFNSNVKLEFYYYPGNTKGKTKLEAQVESKRQERKTMKNVVELLISYGETAANVHGENIVNKLMLEQRLSVLPYPKLYLEEE